MTEETTTTVPQKLAVDIHLVSVVDTDEEAMALRRAVKEITDRYDTKRITFQVIDVPETVVNKV